LSELRKNTAGGTVKRTVNTAANGNRPAVAQGGAVRSAGTVRRNTGTQTAARPAAARPAAASAQRTASPARKVPATTQTVRKTAAGTQRSASQNVWTSEAKGSKKSENSLFGGKLNLDFITKRDIDWPVLIAAAVSAVILIGVIVMMIVLIARCSNGCSDRSESNAGSQKLQIHLSATPEPENTPFADIENGGEENGNEPAVTPVPETTIVPAVNVMNITDNENTEGLRSATIRTIGDFVIHKEVFQSAQRLAKSTGSSYAYNFAPMIDAVWDVIGNADFTVANVDGCLGGRDSYKYGYSGYPQFNTPEYLLYALRDSSVDMLTLANNHMLDGWYDGLMNTIKNVEYVGIKHVGASRSQEERNSPVIYEINGIKVGFMNYTQSLNSMDRAKGLDSRAMQFAVHATSNSNCTADAKRLREAGADVIVCYMHWGEEYRREPDTNQKNLAKTLVGCGVDVIIGGHPHMVQKAEWLSGTNQFGEKQETLCLYSLGNFLSFQREQYKDGGIIFDFTIQEQADGSFAIVNPGYLPIWVWMTGTDASNYNFSVLNIGDYINNPPANMSTADYQKMLQSYNDSVSIMNTGVGSLLKK